MKDENSQSLLFLPAAIVILWAVNQYESLEPLNRVLFALCATAVTILAILWLIFYRSTWGKANRKRRETLAEIPKELLTSDRGSVCLGKEVDLDAQIFLPDHVRRRHVHVLGATGSGKTESVILNLLRQDVARGLGSIILDAKGDHSFLDDLTLQVPADRLVLFDLGSADSIAYDPLKDGAAFESAQRLFSSLTWSEEYYKSKALSALQRIFQAYQVLHKRNPRLVNVRDYLETPKSYSSLVSGSSFPQALAMSEFQDLSGLRDQIRTLTIGHLEKTLSPNDENQLRLVEASKGKVIYFRLQSLISPQLVSILGKLLINHLNFLAGTAHRERTHAKQSELVPVYFDEFASFACPEFADLISKARSAGYALHFSHQSIGDLVEVSKGFLSRITDNAATKIVLRINDPDSAEYMSRSFGTRMIQKTTQRITNTEDIDAAEMVGEGTSRDAHQFRASPDLLKTHPTGTGSVLIAHGRHTPHGASSVFKIRFPELSTAKT